MGSYSTWERFNRVERLRRYWNEGWLSNDIAAMLGVSKSAVCGKARRMNLARRQPGRYRNQVAETSDVPVQLNLPFGS